MLVNWCRQFRNNSTGRIFAIGKLQESMNASGLWNRSSIGFHIFQMVVVVDPADLSMWALIVDNKMAHMGAIH